MAFIHTGKNVKNIICHFLHPFLQVSRPQQIKTDNRLGYLSSMIKEFFQNWNIQRIMGIPYNPTGQAILEHTYVTLKQIFINKKEGIYIMTLLGIHYINLYILSFLSCDSHGLTAAKWHSTPSPGSNIRAKVLLKGIQGNNWWKGPYELITWERGYACVLHPSGPHWAPAHLIKPYHELEGSALQPPSSDGQFVLARTAGDTLPMNNQGKWCHLGTT